MLEETEAYSAPHKPLCMCLYVCVQMHTHTHTHSKEKTVKTKRRCLLFPKRESLCKYHIVTASMKFQVSDFYIYTQTPVVVLSPAHRWTRKLHTIRLLSGLSISLWDIAVGWFFICSFFMLHQPINTFPSLCSEHCVNLRTNLALKNDIKKMIYNQHRSTDVL